MPWRSNFGRDSYFGISIYNKIRSDFLPYLNRFDFCFLFCFMVLIQDNHNLVEARFVWWVVGWRLNGFSLGVVSGILPAMFFYFVEQKNVSLYLILPLFQHFTWNLFDFSRLVSFFSHYAKSDFEHELLSKAIQIEQSQYKKLKSEIETG